MIEFTERMTVPSACERCPLIAQCEAGFNEESEAIDELSTAAMNDEIRQMLIAMMVAADGITAEEAAEIVERNATIVLDEIESAFDLHDKMREAHLGLANRAIANCNGVLKLHAVRGNDDVTAYVCMSDTHMIDEATGSEFAIVERRTIDDQDA